MSQTSIKVSKQSEPSCEICYPTNEETKQIVSNLLQYIFILVGKELPVEPVLDLGGLNGLIKMQFGFRYKNFKETLKCPHKRVHNEFLAALGISSQDLRQLCNIRMVQRAQFNYHVDIIGQQVKTFHHHFLDLKAPLPDKRKSEEKSPVRTDKTVSPPKREFELSRPIFGGEQRVKEEESERDNPAVFPIGFEFGEFNQILNSMFGMTFGSPTLPPQ